MDLKGLKIGYVPVSPDLSHPGDHRRFAGWAKSRGVSFEVADPSKHYDVVLLSLMCDLSVWSRYDSPGAKVVFDFPDAYLDIPHTDPRGMLRGLAKFVGGKSRHLQLDYWEALRAMCRRADGVICTTEEQAATIRPFCENTRIALNVESGLRSMKTDYTAGEVFNLVWEGLPEHVSAFEEIGPVLREIAKERPLALHLVTDLEYRPYLAKFGRTRTLDIARRIFEPAYLYQFNRATAGQIITACDLAVIHIDLSDRLKLGKPITKLLLLWRLGMPVVASATPAYARALKECGVDMACETPQDWGRVLRRCMADESLRRQAGERGLEFAKTRYAEETVLRTWDEAIGSVLGSKGSSRSG